MIYTIKMGKEDVEKIVSEKGGKLIKYTEDVFEEIELKCGNNHLFSLYENDINLGNWCELCQNNKDKIEEILDKLKIKYTKDIKINNILFKYAIEGKRKFLIYDFSDDFEIRFDTASKEGYKSIVLYSVEEPEIEKKIWEGIKDNKDITYIGELEKTGHNCQILTVLQFLNLNLKNSIAKETVIVVSLPLLKSTVLINSHTKYVDVLGFGL